nr:reverse transcriptase domain-containing protein [Tanacetum cinerariifolium]
MSAMANTTPIVTIVTKIATKEKTPNGAESASRVNILDFCEEHYDDIFPVTDKIRRDKRLGHRRQSAFKRLSDTYSPSTTKFGPDMKYSIDGSYSRGRPHKRYSSPSRDLPRSRDCSHGVEESCGNTYPSYRIGDKHRALYKSMDEFYDSEVTITIQRHHWKAWDKRNPSTTIHDSRNAQISRIVTPLQKSIRRSNPSVATPLSVLWTPTKNLEIYVDDLVIKSHTETELLRDIEETFHSLIEKPNDASPEASMIETPKDPWILFTDESSCIDGSEYEALIASIRIAAQMGVRNVHVSVDSKLVENQVLGTYVAKEENMVKRSFLKPWLRCVGPLQADYVIREIHEGSCSMHAGPRSVVAKAMRLGYYWPTIHQDARDMIRTCNACQVLRPVPRNPQQPLTSITAPWPFYKWEIDIAGPFPKGPGKVKFLIVVVDYFTKWIEAKAMATITGSQVKNLGEGIKARLDEGNKNWIEKLPHVLWAHRTMIKSSHGDTPFFLTYGTKAVILAKSKMPTYHTAVVNAVHNNEELRLNLDLPEERRECAAIHEVEAKLKMRKYYTTRVRGVTFRPEDFVYRSNEASHAMKRGKLGPKWEGPHKVTEALGDGAYRLRSMNGTVLPRTWNVANLEKSYL